MLERVQNERIPGGLHNQKVMASLKIYTGENRKIDLCGLHNQKVMASLKIPLTMNGYSGTEVQSP